MKYSAHTYAEALVEALAGAEGRDAGAAMAERFLELVRRNGDERHFPSILEETDRLMRRRNGTRRLIVESARPLDAGARSLVASLAREGDAIEERINPGLIAGIKVTANDEAQFDASLRSKLDSVFGAVE